MHFGDKQLFAFEMNEAAYAPYGIDACMWSQGERIGSDSPHFATYVYYAEGYLQAIEANQFAPSDERLLGKTDIEILEMIHWDEELEDEGFSSRYNINSWDDSLDSWWVYLVPVGSNFKLMWTTADKPSVADFRISTIDRAYFCEKFAEFVAAGYLHMKQYDARKS